VRWTEHAGPLAPAGPVGPWGTYVHTQSGTVVLSGWWRRCGGYVLDTLIVAVPTVLLWFAVGADTLTQTGPRHVSVAAQVVAVVIGLVVALGYPFVLLRHGGRTVGMMAAGIRAVDQVTGGPLTTAQVVRRVLAFFLLVELWAQIAAIIDFNSVLQTTHTYTFGNTSVSESSFHYPWAYVAALLISGAALVATALWPLGNRQKQTLQDKAAGTIVIRWSD
jgi:uncharacterized RDD family membrane protein YckC